MNEKEIERENEKYEGSMTQCRFDKKGHEVYGEKPKMFTKEWWPYFRDYYKVHVIVCLAAAFFIGITIYQMLTTVKFDCNVIYVGQGEASDPNTLFGDSIADVTGDGAVNVAVDCYYLSDNGQYDEYSIAMQQKFMLELAEGDAYLYILSQERYNALIDSDVENTVFLPCSEWLTAEVDESRLVTSGGKAYGVRIDDCEKLKAQGFDTSGKIAVIKSLYERNADDELQKGYFDNAKKAAEYLIE